MAFHFCGSACVAAFKADSGSSIFRAFGPIVAGVLIETIDISGNASSSSSRIAFSMAMFDSLPASDAEFDASPVQLVQTQFGPIEVFGFSGGVFRQELNVSWVVASGQQLLVVRVIDVAGAGQGSISVRLRRSGLGNVG